MVIFNSYVKLPEGSWIVAELHPQCGTVESEWKGHSHLPGDGPGEDRVGRRRVGGR